ncbi:MAG: hypothetical protein AB7S75_23585 [Desulfococcaceae bacterium]
MGGVNLYNYTNNKPLTYIDPLGLEAKALIGGAVKIAGGIITYCGIASSGIPATMIGTVIAGTLLISAGIDIAVGAADIVSQLNDANAKPPSSSLSEVIPL